VKHYSSVTLLVHICTELIKQHSVHWFEFYLDQDGSCHPLYASYVYDYEKYLIYPFVLLVLTLA